MCQGCTCEDPACMGYLYYTEWHRGIFYMAANIRTVAQAVWKPEKHKETSHTTCCHYDNQAESFSLISCHSTQRRNPIAFKSYATGPPIWVFSFFKKNPFANTIHRSAHGFFPPSNFLDCFILKGASAAHDRIWGARRGGGGGAASTTWLYYLSCHFNHIC